MLAKKLTAYFHNHNHNTHTASNVNVVDDDVEHIRDTGFNEIHTVAYIHVVGIYYNTTHKYDII